MCNRCVKLFGASKLKAPNEVSASTPLFEAEALQRNRSATSHKEGVFYALP